MPDVLTCLVPVCADGLACQVAPDPFVITVYARAGCSRPFSCRVSCRDIMHQWCSEYSCGFADDFDILLVYIITHAFHIQHIPHSYKTLEQAWGT